MKLTYNTQPEEPIDIDPLYDEAKKLILETGKASSSLIQRRLKLGYARSARLLDQLEQNGVIGPANGAKPREILITHNNDGEEVVVVSEKRPTLVEERPEDSLIEWKKTKYADNKTDNFGIEIGLDKDNKKVNLDLSKYQSLLVIGNKFTGVSDFLNNVLAMSLAKYSPDELRVITMDGVRNDLIVPNQVPHLLVPNIVDLEKGISALKWAVAEVERRLKTFAEVGDQDIQGWNKNTGFQAMPNILILINSLEQFLLFSPAEMEDNLCRLMLTGKKAGVFFVIGIDPIILRKYKSMLSNNAAKLVFKTPDKSSAKSFETPEAFELDSPDKAILNVLFEENKEISLEKIEPKKIYDEVFFDNREETTESDILNYFGNFKEKFEKMNNDQLLDAFNQEVNKDGWTSSRASYLAALHKEFIDRGFDYSLIGDEGQMSLNKKIKLEGKKVLYL